MNEPRILAVDDEPGLLEVCQDALHTLGVHVEVECSSAKAAGRLGEGWDLLLLDIRMPPPDGLELLARAREQAPGATVILFTGYPTIEAAVGAIKQGAFDYVAKPFTPEQLCEVVKRALEHMRVKAENALLARHVERSYRFDDVVGQSPRLRAVFELVERVAPTESEVLIVGESGTGKELIARSIHARSSRRAARFVPIDCSTIPENLLESELFGHERGAFTGAAKNTVGLFEYADGGTVFLDEVCELPLPMQSKLLRVLQERSFRRVGGREQVRVDVRVIAATNRDVELEVAEGRFRSDLYYRINVVQLAMPPLRERRDDIPILVAHFLERYAREWGRAVKAVSPAALEVLQAYAWPGNVRELQNAVKRAVALARGDVLTAEDLPAQVVDGAEDGGGADGFAARRAQRVAAFEWTTLREALLRNRGDAAAAGRELGIPKATFYRLLKKHGLTGEGAPSHA